MTATPGRDLLNRAVSGTLAVASGAAAAILAAGVVAWLVTGALAPSQGSSRPDAAWPVALIAAGIVVVIATPLVQLGAALVAFLRLGERREAAATVVVLLILAASATAAALLGGRES